MTSVAGGPGQLTLSPADRAAAIAAVKAQARIETGYDDALIAAFAETAIGLAEQFTGRALIVRTMTATLPAGEGWQALPVAPVRAITAVAAGVPPVALAAEAFTVDIDARAPGWVRAAGIAGPLSVTFEAGLASGWAALPPALAQGVALLAAHLMDDRTGATPPPAAVTALWRPFRVMALATEVRA